MNHVRVELEFQLKLTLILILRLTLTLTLMLKSSRAPPKSGGCPLSCGVYFLVIFTGRTRLSGAVGVDMEVCCYVGDPLQSVFVCLFFADVTLSRLEMRCGRSSQDSRGASGSEGEGQHG